VSSSSDTLRLTVVSGVFNRRAAADKLPCSTTARKVDIASRRSIESPFRDSEECSAILPHHTRFRKTATICERPGELAFRCSERSRSFMLLRMSVGFVGPLVKLASNRLPLLSGEGRAPHGEITCGATPPANAGQLHPRLDPLASACRMWRTHAAIDDRSAQGKIVVDLE
jgi:hypothetical protein